MECMAEVLLPIRFHMGQNSLKDYSRTGRSVEVIMVEKITLVEELL